MSDDGDNDSFHSAESGDDERPIASQPGADSTPPAITTAATAARLDPTPVDDMFSRLDRLAGASASASASASARATTVMPLPPYARRPGEVLVPQYQLTEAQRSLVAEMHARLTDVTPAQAAWCDDACLVRYLRARNWHVEPALTLLRHSLQWRDSFGPQRVDPRSIDAEASSGKLYVHGTDRVGRPVMYQRPARQNTKDYVNQVRQVAYFLEREMGSMDLSRGVEQHVVIIDFKGYSIFNAPPMAVSKEVMGILLDQYPERLAHAFMVDAPMLFNVMFKALKPFLSKETLAKVHFVKRKGGFGPRKTMDEAFAAVFDDDQLEEEYGGTLPSTYDHGAYMAAEVAAWELVRERERVL